MAGVTLTQHAIERMRRRGVSRHEIVRVLCFGESSPGHQPGTYKSRIPAGRPADFVPPPNRANNVVVVYQQGDENGERRVITTYRDTPLASPVRYCR